MINEQRHGKEVKRPAKKNILSTVNVRTPSLRLISPGYLEQILHLVISLCYSGGENSNFVPREICRFNEELGSEKKQQDLHICPKADI